MAEVNPKKKILEKLKPDMATDASRPLLYAFLDAPFSAPGLWIQVYVLLCIVSAAGVL